MSLEQESLPANLLPPSLSPSVRVLLSQERLVNNIDSRDEDGWTALHAAVYWENMEAAAMLVKKGAGVHLVTKAVSGRSKCDVFICMHCCQGDTIDDLCRPEFVDELEELKELCEVWHTLTPSQLHSSLPPSLPPSLTLRVLVGIVAMR